MEPRKDENALVDVLDVLLRDGAVIRADVVIAVADVPLVGLKLSAAIAGMETMTEYGLFETWDTSRRNAAIARRQYTESGSPRRIRSSRVPLEDGRGSNRANHDD